MTTRREWLRSAALAAGAAALGRATAAQQRPAGIADTSNLFAMDQAAARTVRLAPKPRAMASMTAEDRDALEHRLRCQCGCTLDVFTCRTTDFSCQVSPAMHRDVMALVEGGYSAQEILDAFVNVYGERVLMAPTREGFNLVGYVLPSVAVGVAGVVLAALLRRWQRNQTPARGDAGVGAPLAEGTPEELARLEAAIRDDS